MVPAVRMGNGVCGVVLKEEVVAEDARQTARLPLP